MASNLTLDNITQSCSLSCEITCDFDHAQNLQVDSEGSVKPGSTLNIRYGKDIYIISKLKCYTSIHGKVLEGRQELELSCNKESSNTTTLKIYLPLTKGDNDYKNKNGNTLKNIKDEVVTSVADFELLFPLNTPYIMYTNVADKCAHIVLSDANIITDIIGETYNNPIDKIKHVMKNMTGLKLHSSGDNKVETIECLPINDDGILLSDVEKGLGDTNITERFNLQKIIDRLLKVPALRIIGGAITVIMLYRLMSMFKNKNNIGVKKMSDINK
tara:strand:+ start:385 stop:1200 length:816 start_codon:yes stop_codon:yes gene_type:complete